jgi:hypothetical protein
LPLLSVNLLRVIWQTEHKAVPDRDEETLVAQTPGQDYLNKKVEINHTPEIKGGLKALKELGLKITYYEEHIPK